MSEGGFVSSATQEEGICFEKKSNESLMPERLGHKGRTKYSVIYWRHLRYNGLGNGNILSDKNIRFLYHVVLPVKEFTRWFCIQ